MFYKLSCGCTVLIVEQSGEGDTLLEVVARTVEHCGRDSDDMPLYFRAPVVYGRGLSKATPVDNGRMGIAGRDDWQKIEEGHPLSIAEETAICEKINLLL